MEEKKAKLSPPWITFMSEVKALFEHDPEIKIMTDEDNYTLKLFVDNTDKAMALSKLLPEKKEYGNVVLKIEVVPANKDEYSVCELFTKAFAGNPTLSYAESYDSPFGVVSYAVFQKKVVQFYNDQMDDINGNRSTLFQDIAKDVFGDTHGIYFCTDVIDPIDEEE